VKNSLPGRGLGPRAETVVARRTSILTPEPFPIFDS
jgi:hypothetical protein